MIEAKQALRKGQAVDDTRKFVVDRMLIHDPKAGPGRAARDARVLEETFRLVCPSGRVLHERGLLAGI
ncbi:MAG: hypothetical protein M1376_13425 [Planctomycetes bacterium]|nr:hypothetical protein [Planctomycetota bacterium]